MTTATTIPAFTYPIPLAGAKPQCVSTADRPWCALIDCLAVQDRLTGAARMLTGEQRRGAIERALLSYDVPLERALLWAAGVAGDDYLHVQDAQVGDITLDLYQTNAVSEMTIAGGVLAMACGLGKTAAVIAAALAAGRTERLWICCPINAFPTWRRWMPYLTERFKEVRILSIDSLHKAHPDAGVGGTIIFDEAHLLGVSKTQRTGHAHRIRRAFDVGFCLTGTLLHGGIEKTLSIRDLAVPGLAQFANRWAAGDYFNCLIKKKLGTRTVTELARPCGPNKTAFFQWLSHACVSLNRHSEEVKQSVVIPDQVLHLVSLGEPWQPLHEVASELALSILETTGKLPDAAKVAHMLCRSGVQAKLAWLAERMDEEPDEPFVVCAEYTDSLDEIEQGLKDAGITYGRVDGSVTGNARLDVQRQFQAGEIRVFLGQMDAATVSLDLDRARYSVAFDHTWKAANYDQFLGRTLRRTQKRECHHYDLACNSLQAKVIDRIREQMDFDASLAEWADMKQAIDATRPTI